MNLDLEEDKLRRYCEEQGIDLDLLLNKASTRFPSVLPTSPEPLTETELQQMVEDEMNADLEGCL